MTTMAHHMRNQLRNHRKPEVRTLMTVVAVGAAHKPKIIVSTPVATG